MRSKIVTLLFAVISVFSFAQSNTDVVGEWYSAKDGIVIRLFEVDQTISGEITWMKSQDDEKGNLKTDLLNSDESLIARVGMVMMYDFTYIAGNIWDNGSIYIPKKEKTYSGMMRLKDKNTLNVRGYIGFSFFERYSSTWTRIVDKDKFSKKTIGERNILIQLGADLERIINRIEDVSLKPAAEIIQKIENENLLIKLRQDLGKIIKKIEGMKKAE
jgi:uncharacterized protein (DUF2147 family)